MEMLLSLEDTTDDNYIEIDVEDLEKVTLPWNCLGRILRLTVQCQNLLIEI